MMALTSAFLPDGIGQHDSETVCCEQLEGEEELWGSQEGESTGDAKRHYEMSHLTRCYNEGL